MALKPLGNTANINSVANNCFLATAVYIVAGAAATVTVANTANDDGTGKHGNYDGSAVTIRVPTTGVVIRKRPYDTVVGTGCYATKVAEGDN
jgi:hypothetical protein